MGNLDLTAKSEPTSRASEFYKAYEEHSKNLRTWLVAYGIGAPVLFLTNEPLSARVTSSTNGQVIGLLFLVGVIIQVLLAALNKAIMWTCYFAELYPDRSQGFRHRTCYWLSEQFWIDLLADVASLFLFGVATWLAFTLALG